MPRCAPSLLASPPNHYKVTPVHYFGALAMVLDRSDSHDPANGETTAGILYLLSLVLPECVLLIPHTPLLFATFKAHFLTFLDRVPPSIVRRRTGSLSKLLVAVCQANKEEQVILFRISTSQSSLL